jgi:hypothetical protein
VVWAGLLRVASRYTRDSAPDSPLALEWSSVVCHSALPRGATVGTNPEGHGVLAGRGIVGRATEKRQEPNWEIVVFLGGR